MRGRLSNLRALLAVFAAGAQVAGCSIMRYERDADIPQLPKVFDAENEPVARRLRQHIGEFLNKERNLGSPDASAKLAGAAEGIRKVLGDLKYANLGEVPLTEQGVMHCGRFLDAKGPGYRVLAIDDPAGPAARARNIEVILPGKNPVLAPIVVGAHYDSALATPGANDNGSGSAALLELARFLHDEALTRTIRLVFFVNEEEPYFTRHGGQHSRMGSWVYARSARHCGMPIEAMYSLETIGYFTEHPDSQCMVPVFPRMLFDRFPREYPPRPQRHDPGPNQRPGPPRADGSAEPEKNDETGLPLPNCLVPGLLLGEAYGRGDFLAVVGPFAMRALVRSTTESLRRIDASARAPAGLRVEGFAIASLLPGIDWSDHRSFSDCGYSAVMITDTAPARYPYYHYAEDRVTQGEKPQPIHFDMLALVARRLARYFHEAANATGSAPQAGDGRCR